MDDLFCEYQPLRARFKDQAKAYAVPAPERQLQTSQTEELRRLKAELKCVTKERGILKRFSRISGVSHPIDKKTAVISQARRLCDQSSNFRTPLHT